MKFTFKKILTALALLSIISSYGCSSDRDKWKSSYGRYRGNYSNNESSGNSSYGRYRGTHYPTHKVPNPLPIAGLVGLGYFVYKLKTNKS